MGELWKWESGLKRGRQGFRKSFGGVSWFVEKLLRNLDSGYQRTLRQVLRLRWMVMLMALGIAGLGGLLLTQLKSELSPTEDRGTIIVSGNAPEGASFAYTQRYAEQVEAILQDIPDLRSALLIVGAGDVTRMNSFARLKDWSERTTSQQETVQKLLPKLRAIAGIQASASNPASLGVRGFGKPMQFVIQSSASYEELNRIASQLVEKLKDNPGLADLDTDLRLNKPEVQIDIDRARAADLGLDVTVIGRTLETLLGGRNVSTFAIGSASPAMVDAYKRSRDYMDAAISIVKPGITTADVVKLWPKAQEFGFANEEAAFALQYGHGVGLSIWEKPIFSRLVSLDHPEVIEEGMVFALETYWPASDGWSAARLEEEVVVTKDGCEVITRFPSEKLLVAGTHYFTTGGELPTTRETQSNLNNPGALERVKG